MAVEAVEEEHVEEEVEAAVG
jgi:hypothetical protein